MNIWTSPTVVRDLGWTLVHFLWEGLVIAGLLAAGLRLFKNSAARFKYLAGCAALALMALAPLVTLAVVARQNPAPAISSAHAGSDWIETAAGGPAIPPLVPNATRDARAASFSHELEMLFPWLVLGWVVGVCGLSGRLLAGWFQVRRLRSHSTEPLPWTEPFAVLARRLEVSRPVRLLQSALVEVPTVIGWLRPVILLPASCVTGLTSRQLESIIAHELAHIRRHDYLINLLQSAVETLLFYHPAVWWVSRRIRDEREHCCDDLAVEVCGDRAGYARALATLEELRPASAQLALAAAGAPLLQRIRRLAGQPERSAGRASWPVAGITLLLVIGILAAGMREHRAAAQGVHEVAPVATTVVWTNSPVAPTARGDRVLTLAQNTANPADAAALETRTFHIDPGTFIQAVESAVGRTGAGGADAGTAALTDSDLRAYLLINGVDLGTNNGKVVIFNDRIGVVTVRATPQDLHLIETALSMLPASAQEVNIKAKFVQITSAPGETNGIFYLGANRTAASVTGILTEPQFHAAINAIEQHDGTDVLTAPEVTTESGRQAQMQSGEMDPIVLPGKGTNTSITNMFFGETLDVLATVSADKKMISMRLRPSISEFLGYEKVSTNSAMLPLPRFQLRKTTANVTTWDGNTVVIGGLMNDSTNAGSQAAKKTLLVFVTATIINPDGTLYNSEEERKAHWSEPPPAQGSANPVNPPSNAFPGALPKPVQGSN